MLSVAGGSPGVGSGRPVYATMEDEGQPGRWQRDRDGGCWRPGRQAGSVLPWAADSRLSARLFAPAASELALRLVAPDRPGIGRTEPRGLRWLADWVEDAELVLDAVAAGPAALLGVSAGGPFAAACAARLPGHVRSLTLIAPLGAQG